MSDSYPHPKDILLRKIWEILDSFKLSHTIISKEYNEYKGGLDNARKAFKGEAKRLGLKTEEDVVNLVKEVRKERSKEMTKHKLELC